MEKNLLGSLCIYSNGTIEFKDYHFNKMNKKKTKISKEELNQLKEIAQKIESQYQPRKYEINEIGLDFSYKIYNGKEWIVLDDVNGYNPSQESIVLMKNISELREKYIDYAH